MSCFCGQFTISVEGSFGDVRYCHCSQCREKTGSAFTANARIKESQFSIHGPIEMITEFEHKPGLFNAFCSRCGSPLYARSADDPTDIRVRLGGFGGELDVNVTGHVWVSSKADWYEIQDDLPQYDQGIDNGI
jgi:hypothetical protein